MSFEAAAKVTGDAGVEAWRVLAVLEDVDDALGQYGHAQNPATGLPTRCGRKIGLIECLMLRVVAEFANLRNQVAEGSCWQVRSNDGELACPVAVSVEVHLRCFAATVDTLRAT